MNPNKKDQTIGTFAEGGCHAFPCPVVDCLNCAKGGDYLVVWTDGRKKHFRPYHHKENAEKHVINLKSMGYEAMIIPNKYKEKSNE